jgi:Family of unknown function (DUF6353)
MISVPRTHIWSFDRKNPNWVDNQEHNQQFIQAMVDRLNDVVRFTDSPVTINDLGDLLGFNRTEGGALVGWTKGPVDYEMKVNPKTIRLTFRVEGEILDATKEA